MITFGLNNVQSKTSVVNMLFTSPYGAVRFFIDVIYKGILGKQFAYGASACPLEVSVLRRGFTVVVFGAVRFVQ